MADLSELGLSSRVVSALRRAGIDTVEDLVSTNSRQLLALQGVGPGALRELEQALTQVGEVLASDPFGPYECAREGKRVRDAQLTDLWLCEECARQFQEEAFGGTAPAFVAGFMGGHCVNCGEEKRTIRLRQWFLCGVCGRVASSIGRSVVAARAVLESWAEIVEPATGLALVEVDIPRLARRGPSTLRDKVPRPDFVANDSRGASRLAIEMKTGPGGLGSAAVRPMTEFQLDVSDCVDIQEVAKTHDLPMYVVHAQVVTRAVPPTNRFVAVGTWWTDMFSMRAAFKRIAIRPRETRPAAYFRVECFRPISELASHLGGAEARDIRRRVTAEGIPTLYDPAALTAVIATALEKKQS